MTEATVTPEEVAERLQLALYQLWTRHRRYEAVDMAAGRLSSAQLAILSVLTADGPSRVSDLAVQLEVRKPSITVAVHRLLRSGLVIRSSGPSDLREIYIAITELGRTHHHVAQVARHELAEAAVLRLSPPDREVLRRALPLLEQMGAACHSSANERYCRR